MYCTCLFVHLPLYKSHTGEDYLVAKLSVNPQLNTCSIHEAFIPSVLPRQLTTTQSFVCTYKLSDSQHLTGPNLKGN